MILFYLQAVAIRPGCFRTSAVQRTDSTAPACAGAVRCVSVSVPPPACADALAPRRLRVPDLTPPTSKRARSGTLQLCYASKHAGGGTNPETALQGFLVSGFSG